MFACLQRLPAGYHARAQSGDVVARFSGDVASVESLVTNAVPIAILSLLNVLASVVLLFLLEWRLALITLAGLLLGLIAPRSLGAKAAAASYLRKRDEGRLLGLVGESMGAQAVVKAFGLQGLVQGKLQERVRELVQSTLRVGLLAALVERSAQIGILALDLVVLGAGGYLAFRGSLSIGALVAFHALFQNLQHLARGLRVRGAPDPARDWQPRARSRAPRRASRRGPSGRDSPAAVLGGDRLEGVTFGYSARQPTLQGASFQVRRGQRVAFVGPSGSGKSTLLSAASPGTTTRARGGEVRRGRPRWTGTSPCVLEGAAGVVSQDIFLFNTTVRENIRMGGGRPRTRRSWRRPGRPRSTTASSSNMPRGYDTRSASSATTCPAASASGWPSPGARARSGDTAARRGHIGARSRLGGGDQRDALARRGRAHRALGDAPARLGDVGRSDLRAGAGALREQGTHTELLRLGGLYKELWDKQSGFTLSDDGWHALIEPSRLRSVPLLRSLDDGALAAIAQRFATEIYPAKYTLFEAGDPGDRFYMVVRGAVDVFVPGAAGRMQRRNTLQDGDYFGEMALLRDVARCATVRTTKPSLLLTLRREPFMNLVAQSPGLRRALDSIVRARSGVQA